MLEVLHALRHRHAHPMDYRGGHRDNWRHPGGRLASPHIGRRPYTCWRHDDHCGFGGSFLFLGRKLSSSLTSVAENPSSWFTLAMFIVALFIFPRQKAPFESNATYAPGSVPAKPTGEPQAAPSSSDDQGLRRFRADLRVFALSTMAELVNSYWKCFCAVRDLSRQKHGHVAAFSTSFAEMAISGAMRAQFERVRSLAEAQTENADHSALVAEIVLCAARYGDSAAYRL